MSKKRIILISLILLIGLISTVILAKRISPLSWEFYGKVNAPGGVAIEGYDPVNYHLNGKPIEGSSNYTFEYNGVKWYFATKENKEEFEKSPERFMPAFGGFCAFAASKGFTARIDPTAWFIEDGKLYLFNDHEMKENWKSELKTDVIEHANIHWKKRNL